MTSFRVEISGGIASGKTTLATLLAQAGLAPITEEFRANPFWEAFYSDPDANAFETEITFLLQHYHAIKLATSSHTRFACDFSLYLDLAYSRVTLSTERRAAFSAVYGEVRRELHAPQLLIHLRCDPVIELERIRRRARAPEVSISLDYLRNLASCLEEVLNSREHEGRILVIDSGAINFAFDEAARHATVQQIVSLADARAPGPPRRT